MSKYLFLILFTAVSQLVGAQTTDFTYQAVDNGGCLPIDIQFTQTSSGSPVGYLWDFGNGVRSNSANPVITFTEAGNYSVRLITVYANSTAEKTRSIVVHPSITANFTTDRNYMCQPGTVNFNTSASANLASYVWDFGDGSAPVTGTSTNVSHNYSGFGEFTATLTATSTTGCTAVFTSLIKVVPPEVSGSITSATTGCAPMTTDFRTNVNLPPNSSVTNYRWDFGDGSVNNSLSAQASHTYTQVGAFSPSVTITTVEGCTNTFRFDSLFFGRPPTNHIAYPFDTVLCASETAQFVAHATEANRYDWDFGNGDIISFPDTIVEHKYNQLGIQNVSVTPYYNGCAGTPVNFQINIIGVIARFRYKNTCEDKKTFLFKNTSQGNISTINWNLGDQTLSTSMDTILHTYPPTGAFPVKLLITDNITGCVDSFKANIYTANPVLKNDDRSICINTESQFSVLNNYTNPSLSYTWMVLGNQIGPTSDSMPIVRADSLGHFTNIAILNNGSQYCADSIQLDHVITVRGPKLDFTAPDDLCLNTPLSVVNLSHPFQAADTVNLWYWNFGRVLDNDTVFQPQPYTYTVAKRYNVKLTAVDIAGCRDTLVKKVFVRPMPFIWIIPKLDTVCQGGSTTLIGYTSDEILWTPVNTNYCTTCDTTSVRPTETTKYIATATNVHGCASVDSAVVRVFSPFNAVSLTPDTSYCSGTSIQLDVEPKGKVITWTPAVTLSNANIYNPVASPPQSTLYTASLIDSAGCFSSSTTINLNVKSKPIVDLGPDRTLPYNTAFRLTSTHSNNISTWLWTPSDSLECSFCPTASGVALATNKYTVKVTSDSGCVAQDDITIFVECKGANVLMPGAFTPNNDRRNDLYRPITRGIQYIKRFAVFNREGQLVYELKNYVPNKENLGWDGKYRGRDQNPAAYMYFVEAVCDIGQTIFSKGSFILIR